MIRNSSVDKGFFFVRIECDQSGDLTSVLSGQVLIREMGLTEPTPLYQGQSNNSIFNASSIFSIYKSSKSVIHVYTLWYQYKKSHKWCF